jgi:hypothetical protein
MDNFTGFPRPEGSAAHAEGTVLVGTDILHSLFAALEDGSLLEAIPNRMTTPGTRVGSNG